MKNLTPSIIGGLTVLAAVSCTVNTEQAENKQLPSKEETLKTLIKEQKANDDELQELKTSFYQKLDTVYTARNAKLKDEKQFFQATGADYRYPILIYKFETPDGETIKLISDQENIFIGENHNIKYIELNKGAVLNGEEAYSIFYGTRYGEHKKLIPGIDGILIDYKELKRE